jgi:hypothetical protein
MRIVRIECSDVDQLSCKLRAISRTGERA